MDRHALEITDHVSGRPSSVEAALHFHPDVIVEDRKGRYQILLSDGRKVVMTCIGWRPSVEKSFWHPEFGVSIANQKVRFKADSDELKILLSFVG